MHARPFVPKTLPLVTKLASVDRAVNVFTDGITSKD
jgi:hypothetical protein